MKLCELCIYVEHIKIFVSGFVARFIDIYFLLEFVNESKNTDCKDKSRSGENNYIDSHEYPMNPCLTLAGYLKVVISSWQG